MQVCTENCRFLKILKDEFYNKCGRADTEE